MDVQEDEEHDDVQGCQGCDHFVCSDRQQHRHIEECSEVFQPLIKSDLGEKNGQA